MPFETPIPIRHAVQNVIDGKYVLPAIQREFIWSQNKSNCSSTRCCAGIRSAVFCFGKCPAIR